MIPYRMWLFEPRAMDGTDKTKWSGEDIVIDMTWGILSIMHMH